MNKELPLERSFTYPSQASKFCRLQKSIAGAAAGVLFKSSFVEKVIAENNGLERHCLSFSAQ